MGEIRGAGGEVEIGRLRQQILALADGDCLRPEDGRALLAALDAALEDMAVGDMPGARAGIERFIAETQGLIEVGVLAGREGNTALEEARRILSDPSD